MPNQDDVIKLKYQTTSSRLVDYTKKSKRRS